MACISAHFLLTFLALPDPSPPIITTGTQVPSVSFVVERQMWTACPADMVESADSCSGELCVCSICLDEVCLLQDVLSRLMAYSVMTEIIVSVKPTVHRLFRRLYSLSSACKFIVSEGGFCAIGVDKPFSQIHPTASDSAIVTVCGHLFHAECCKQVKPDPPRNTASF